MELEQIKSAAKTGTQPEGLTIPEQFLYLRLYEVWNKYKNREITTGQATSLKNYAMVEYNILDDMFCGYDIEKLKGVIERLSENINNQTQPSDEDLYVAVRVLKERINLRKEG